MIKGIVFDFDGTVSNRSAYAYATYRDYFRPLFADLDDVEFEAVMQDMMLFDVNGIVGIEEKMPPFIRKYADHLPTDFKEKFYPYYKTSMWKYTVLKEETTEVLEKLKSHYKLGLLSNGDPYSQHHKIDKSGIAECFDAILVSGDIGIHKPDPKIFRHMADRLGVKCEECMVVGDVFATDILGAHRAGMLPVWMRTDPEKPAEFYKGYIISDLRELFAILEKENGKI